MKDIYVSVLLVQGDFREKGTWNLRTTFMQFRLVVFRSKLYRKIIKKDFKVFEIKNYSYYS